MPGAAFGQTSSGGGGGSTGGLTDVELRATPVPVVDAAGNTLIGAVTETAPATDTASSGLNGRLQRVSQRLTSLLALLPTSLGQKTMANSLAVTLASDQTALSVSTNGLTDAQLRASAVPVDTELPAAAALADSAANPTAPAVGAFGMLWNGATWDRAPGAAATGLKTSRAADTTTTGTVTANGQSVTAAVATGAGGVAFTVFGTYAIGLTWTWEFSPDGGTTYIPFAVTNIASVSANVGFNMPVTLQSQIANASVCYTGDIPAGATHVRARVSAWAAPTGTANVVIGQAVERERVPPSLINSLAVTTLGTVTPGTAATSLGKAEDAAAATGDVGVFALGVRNDTQSQPTNADGDYIQQSHDARGAQRVNTASFGFQNIATSTTTTVKSGAGELHSITINSLGTVASTVTIFDNTTATGTKIGTINSLSISGTLTFDVAFATGLTIVTTGTVAPDITVSFR